MQNKKISRIANTFRDACENFTPFEVTCKFNFAVKKREITWTCPYRIAETFHPLRPEARLGYMFICFVLQNPIKLHKQILWYQLGIHSSHRMSAVLPRNTVTSISTFRHIFICLNNKYIKLSIRGRHVLKSVYMYIGSV